MTLWPAALLLLAPVSTRADARGTDLAPALERAAPGGVPELASPSLPLDNPAVAAGLLVPAPKAGLSAQAAQVPALPLSQVAAALPAAPASAAQVVPLAQDKALQAASVDTAGWQEGAALFDRALEGKASPITVFSRDAAAAQESQAYARAVRSASSADWTGRGPAVVAAALPLLARLGARTSAIEGGLRVTPVKGVSALNDLAFELKRSLGADMDYVPERTRGANGSFNGQERRLFIGGFDKPDLFISVLHELRHAWYSAQLKRGRVRLFHLQLVARRGGRVSPYATGYVRYVSLEELSTFPKTLKHTITELLKMEGEPREYLEGQAAARAYQLYELLQTASYSSYQLSGASRWELARLKPEEAAALGLDPVEGLEYMRAGLPASDAYVPVPAGTSRRKAAASLRRQSALVSALSLKLAPSVEEYLKAARAKDWRSASAAADRMIAAVRDAEARWDGGQ